MNNGTQPVYNYYYRLALARWRRGDRVRRSYNRIGTDGESVDNVGERNVIAGSDNDGVDIVGSGASENIVAGNFIGTDATGTSALGIAGDGVFITAAAGSTGSVSTRSAVRLSPTWERDLPHRLRWGADLSSSNWNVVAGNLIGTDVTGTVALGNSGQGVEIDAGSFNNTIGDTAAGAGNVIWPTGRTAY